MIRTTLFVMAGIVLFVMVADIGIASVVALTKLFHIVGSSVQAGTQSVHSAVQVTQTASVPGWDVARDVQRMNTSGYIPDVAPYTPVRW